MATDRRGRVEDLPAMVVRQARAGYCLEQAARDIIGAPCRILESDFDIAAGRMSLELEVPGETSTYLSDVELEVRGGDMTLVAGRCVEILGSADVEGAIERGRLVDPGELGVCRPVLEIYRYEDSVIMEIRLSCRMEDFVGIGAVEDVMRRAEFAMLRTGDGPAGSGSFQ
ncbi:hypothetical protein IBTHAUMO2_150017 [Nitrosopumilaceae archaeon]|nr:hypothetical protein [Nitrosopumilus sp.]CAI9831063.1 hypothetical protein IBTHAUMO2_150017 [Nitrosopumilaceae archaeon]MDA7945784.1 hypothetical protein [Nitrosopumilus sp.]MDA7954806.1 hypothetical protein [Nitrosopumilus sp.]MDA7974516.1 hypothetical protein [Nitrosopumilus sp.]